MNPEAKKILISAIIISSLCSLVFGSLAGLAVGVYLVRHGLQPVQTQNSASNANPNQPAARLLDEQSAVEDVVASTSPAVVSIIISKDLPKVQNYDPFQNDPFFRQFFGDQFNQFFGNTPQPSQPNGGGNQPQEIGGGTGFIITPDGYIVTNRHVVADPTADYTVLLGKDQKYSAKVLARDSMNDLAILKIDAKDLPTLQLGDSNQLRVGQSVIAIGNALGEFRNTVSTGVVSGLSRSVTAGGADFGAENLAGVIQTDASINPGNSGGPLLDLNGQVIGINTAIAQGAQGIGFAIPINEVKSSIDSVKTYGKIVRPWLGVRIQLIDQSLQQADKLPYDYGALIVRGTQPTDLAVIPGSPADKAGLVENDIILEVNGTKVDAANSLPKLISNNKIGDTVTLKIFHKGKEELVKTVLTEQP